MLDFLSTQNALHVRTIDITLEEYLFVLQVVMGEQPALAYASIYDKENFKSNVPGEDEDEYIAGFKKDAENFLETQNCVQLREYLEQEYQSEIQTRATNLEDYKFTGQEIQRLLSNLLKNRSEDLSDASVRDVLSLVKSMFDNGYLSSDDSFQRHFITIPNKYNALCINCGREFYATQGIDIKCPQCGQVYKWADERFYPQPTKL